jgi:hypothetical protein
VARGRDADARDVKIFSPTRGPREWRQRRQFWLAAGLRSDGTLFITSATVRAAGGQNRTITSARSSESGDGAHRPQSVRRSGRLQAEIYSLGYRNQQLALIRRAGTVGKRTRPQRRRRDQHHPAGQELRVAAGQLWAHVAGAAAVGDSVARRDGAADRLLDAVDRRIGHDVLHRRQVSELERERLRRRATAGRDPAPAIIERIVFNDKFDEMRRSRFSPRCASVRDVAARDPMGFFTC